MITMKGKDDFKGRYDFFKWSAPIYETPEEVVRAVNILPLEDKRVKGISVIGSAWKIGGHEKQQIYYRLCQLGYDYDDLIHNGYEHLDKVQIPCQAEIFEPFQIIFEDGDTLDFLPMEYGGARVAKNSIPAGLTYGMNRCNFDAQPLLGEGLIGAKFCEFSIDTIKENTYHYNKWNIANGSSARKEIKTTRKYIFKFDNGHRLEIEHQYGDYTIKLLEDFQNKAVMPYSKLKTIEKPMKQIEIEYIDGLMVFSAFNSKAEYPDHNLPRTRYKNWSASVDDLYAEMFLLKFLYRYYDETIQDREEYEQKNFDWYGHNYYTFEAMRSMISDLYTTADLLETNYDSAELDDIKKHFCAYSFPNDPTREHNTEEEKQTLTRENILIAADFYRRFAERLETLLRECDDCDMVVVSGP